MPEALGVHRGPRRRSERLRQSLLRRRRRRRGGFLTSTRRVLGVDPGSRRAGWAVLTGTPYRPVLDACGEIVLPERLPFAERLSRLHRELAGVVAIHRPTEAAVETPFHGVSARSALQLAHARGVILAVLGSAAVTVHEYTPATIKKTVTGNGRAEKGQVQAMVARLVDAGTAAETPDIADAVAAALCHLFGAARVQALAKAGVRSRRR